MNMKKRIITTAAALATMTAGAAFAQNRGRIVIATKFGLTFDAPESSGPHKLIPDSSAACPQGLPCHGGSPVLHKP